MADTRYTTSDVVRLGKERYERDIRALVEAEHTGKFLVLDVETGEYEIDQVDVLAITRAKAKRPEAPLYILRIGRPAAYRLGALFRAPTP